MRTAITYKIFVVDNASTEPDTAKELTNYSNANPNVQVVYNSSNLGFSGGVNTGIRFALDQEYSHIALLNNDAVVADNWLDSLLTAFNSDKKIGIVTGSFLHRDGETIDSTGEQYSLWGLPFPRSRGLSSTKLPDSALTFGATGGASLYSGELFKDIGLFDKSFFAYYEDVDISFRAQLAGWSVYFEKKAIAYHTRGASSSKIPGFTVRQAIRNLPLLYIRNIPGGLLIPVGIRFWLAYLLITTKAILSPNMRSAIVGLLQAMWLFWTHGIPSRFGIQRKNRVSTQHVRNLLWNDLPPDQTGLRKLFGKSVK